MKKVSAGGGGLVVRDEIDGLDRLPAEVPAVPAVLLAVDVQDFRFFTES